MNTIDMAQENTWNKIRSKVEEYKPEEYSPADWDEMSALLDTEEKKRVVGMPLLSWIRSLKGGKLLLMAGVFVVSLAVAISLLRAPAAQNRQQGLSTSTASRQTETSSPWQPAVGEIASGAAQQPVETERQAAATHGQRSEKDNGPAQLADQHQSAKQGKRAAPHGRAHQGLANGPAYRPAAAGLGTADANDNGGGDQDSLLSAENHGSANGLTASETTVAAADNRQGQIAGLLPSLAIAHWAADSTAPALHDFDSPKPAIRKPADSATRFGVVLGINNSITDYGQLKTSHLPFVGVFATKRISNRWEVQLEGHFKTVNNYDLFQTFTVTEYNANGLPTVTTLGRFYTRYQAIEFPICLKYTLNNRMGLIAGTRLSIIAADQIGNGIGGFLEESDREAFPFKGFWGSDIGLVAGAEYLLGPRWLVDLRWNQGFRDLTPDILYNGDTAIHLNADLQLSIRYFF